ncbi:hypothetical protein [Paenibacillus tengchongensis]|uniref:hypothetical protein n=1 Tax=Paenibacillus tengchongensis TaxID=2608684 RepID=UPI00124C170B|nr:hypothetical protein [Paenibacillus tengchongensis]
MTTINEEIAALLRDSGVSKVLATADMQGVPHILLDQSITINDEGQIVYLELTETSQTNVNLVNSIWFKRRVAVTVSTGKETYQIKGTPAYSIICGPVFEHYYKQALERNPDYDLSTVWLIEPEEITADTYAHRRSREQAEHPLVMHLDRLALGTI